MILNSEFSRKRIKHVKKLVKEGREEVLRVLRVDTSQGYIDLSKKSVKLDEMNDFHEFYSKSKRVHNIMKSVAQRLKIELELLYVKLGWPLYRDFEHAFEAFKEMMNTDNYSILNKYDISDEYKKVFIDVIKVKMVPHPVKIRADFKLTCYTSEGIDAIKYALQEGEKLTSIDIPIKFNIIGAPIYECSITTVKRNEGMSLIKEALRTVENAIKLKNGNFILNNKVSIYLLSLMLLVRTKRIKTLCSRWKN